MRTIYIADDGKQFDDEIDCIDYEWKLKRNHLSEIEIYDENGRKLENIFLENSYNKSEKVVVKSQEAANDLHDFAKYTGYCEYYKITSPGVWIWNEGYGFLNETRISTE